MKTIVIVSGSARPNSVNHHVVEYIRTRLEEYDAVQPVVADLVAINLPFFNAATPPSDNSYSPPTPAVAGWSRLISDADGVLFVAPEYNHGLSAIQKNAIDWLYHEWKNKPAAFIGYGWYAGAHSLAQLKEISTVIKLALGETTTGLQFNTHITPDGTILDAQTVNDSMRATIDELLAQCKSIATQ